MSGLKTQLETYRAALAADQRMSSSSIAALMTETVERIAELEAEIERLTNVLEYARNEIRDGKICVGRKDKEIERLRAVLLGYIDHVGECEGVAFIEGMDHYHPSLTDEQWGFLKALQGDSDE